MDNKQYDCRLFPQFYNHSVIQKLGEQARWTISGPDKVPIDFQFAKDKSVIIGAQYTDELSLVPLKELQTYARYAANNAYYLDVLRDGYVVLDIEPKCPDDIKAKLLQSSYVYGEISMSGKGYHLIFPVPDCFNDYPIAQQKIVMKEEHGYYEVLLCHWVTFTRNMIPLCSNPATDFNQIFAGLCKKQKETFRTDVAISEYMPKDIPNYDLILRLLSSARYLKKPEDFNDDGSRYEYGCVGFYHYRLQNVLNTNSIRKNGHTYTPNEKTWILYGVVTDKLPYRPKHDTMRDNLPWLLYLCREVVAKNTEEKS